jgi:molybdopterin converting factor small subunit
MIKVEVEAFAFLRDFLSPELKNGPKEILPEDQTTIGRMLDQIRIPESAPKVVLVNERSEKWDYCLKEGDIVEIFPPLDGG